MATRLEIVNGEVAAKRATIGELLKKRPNKDFTTEELKQLQTLNSELAPLAAEQAQLQDVYKMISETESFLSDNAPVGEKLPGGAGNGDPVGVKMPNGEILNLRDTKGNLLPDSEIADRIKSLAETSFNTANRFNEPGGLGTAKTARELADVFIKSEAFTKYSPGSKSSPAVEREVKTLLDTTGFPIASTRSNLLLPIPTRRLVVADLFPNGNISQPRFLYMEETLATNNAAFVAEGGQKPESALEFAERSADVRKIATVLPVTDEMFQDAPAMRSYVQNRLIQFLQFAEDSALLNGSGVAPDIEGILNNGGIQTQAKGADTIPDALYKAVTKVEVNSFLPTSGMVLHPNDWMRVRLSKDANGQYLFGSPMVGDLERIFGYPVVRTSAIAEGTALVGAFDLAAMILRRTGIQFAVSTEHADFFIKNKLMLRVEERLAFPVFRPAGFCEVTGLNA